MLNTLNFLIGKRLSIWHNVSEKFYNKVTTNIIKYSTDKSRIVLDNKELYLYLKDKIIDKTVVFNTPAFAGNYVIGNTKSYNIFGAKNCNHIISFKCPPKIYYDIIATYNKFGDIQYITYNKFNITNQFLPDILLDRIEELTKLDKILILNAYKLYTSTGLDIKEYLLKLLASNKISVCFYTEDDSNINKYINQYIDMLPKSVYLVCLNKHDRKLNNNKNRCILTPYYSDRVFNNLERCPNKIAIPLYKGCKYIYIPEGDYTYVIGKRKLCNSLDYNIKISRNKIQDIIYNNNNSLIFNKEYLLKYLENYKNNKGISVCGYHTI